MKTSIIFVTLIVLSQQEPIFGKDQDLRKQDLQSALDKVTDLKWTLQTQVNAAAVHSSIELLGA